MSNIFELGYQPEDQQPFAAWALANIRLRDSPYGEKFLLDETPWLKAPLDTLLCEALTEVVMMCCAQGGKTVTLHSSLLWALCRRPGPTMFVAQTIDAAKDQAKGRIMPMIEACPALSGLLPSGKGRHNKSWKQTLLPNATLLIGPANDTFLRSHTIQWLFGDECSAWEPGSMEKARARTRRVWNRKHFFASTPLEEGAGADGDEFAKSWRKGNQQRYHLATPCCGHLVYLTSDNLEKLFTWDKPLAEAALKALPLEEKKEEGSAGSSPRQQSEWDLLRASVRLVCPKCGAQHQQTEELYRKMIAGARYVSANPKASSDIASFAFNVLCLPMNVMPWAKIVQGWIEAKAEEVKGNLAPLKEFVTLNLAEPWNARKFLSYSLPKFSEYDPKEAFGEFSALTVDCQEHLAEFHCVARAWAKGGASRLLEARTVNTEAEIKELQLKWSIKPHLVALDCAYKPYEVFELCVKNGWTALLGDDREDWVHSIDEKGHKVRMPFSPPERKDPRSGKVYAGRTCCWCIKWSNPVIKDLLWRLKEGRGAPWAVCDLGPEMNEIYAKGIDSERKREDQDRFGRLVLRWKKIRANHFWDAECMQVVLASLARLFIFGSDGGDKAKQEGDTEPAEAAEGTEKGK